MRDTTPTATIAQALRIIVRDAVRTEDGVIESCLHQAAARLEEQEAALGNYRLRDEVKEALEYFTGGVNHHHRWHTQTTSSLLAMSKCLNREIEEWEDNGLLL